MTKPLLNRFAGSVAWNLFLITSGVILFSIGAVSIAMPMEFVSGGLFGTGMLIYYVSGYLSAPIWYFILNIPLFILGWKFLSRRFILYSLYGFIATTVISELITFKYYFDDPLLAAVAAAGICGAGLGLIVRSLGSDGGVTIVAIILHQKYNARMGQVFFIYNSVLFAFSLFFLDVNKVMYSLIYIFIMSTIMEYCSSLFNHRKIAMIISDRHKEIADAIMSRLHRGATFIPTRGAYTDKNGFMVMTVLQNYQIKRLEELVFELDEDAFVIIENTFNVMGIGFSKRKTY